MDTYEMGPLLQSSTLSGGLFWALALYLPLSGPLQRLEASLEDGPLSGAWRQAALVISSLLLALAVGVITQLILAWALGPGWASSLALITIGWSLFLVVARGQGD
ncbi:hypothetical protein [Synechococcus sp. ROS8604]|jgi:hypothetical protein|uniref:hypothetical protein n=1 Tax=Synechococcus sp. ROS8604 TaxID=1442557 RepID=UPI001646ADDA|nr:hypothetical protein [Synechococcus sp. ROS8604]|tara:strand:- start:54 stop:368 length:315 start_codon:yes stop_codon:yes gene_type:complete